MKKCMLFLLIGSLIFSCKKNNGEVAFKNEIVGTWEYRQFSCGECPNPFTTYPAGNGKLLVFFANGDFEKKSHDTLIFKGTYLLQKSTVCGNPATDVELTTNESSTLSPFFINIKKDTMTLGTPNCYLDGASSTYLKIK